MLNFSPPSQKLLPEERNQPYLPCRISLQGQEKYLDLCYTAGFSVKNTDTHDTPVLQKQKVTAF